MKIVWYIVVIVVVVIGIVLLRPLWCGDDDPVTHLVIEHTNAGPWMDMNNTFSDVFDEDDAKTFRPGVLFQLGDYAGMAFYNYLEVRIFEGSTPTVFKDGVWVNIISEFDEHPGEPMLPDEAFILYPNSNPASGCVADDINCLRNRSLHGGMNENDEIKSLMTYWQGPNGYRISAQEEKQPNSGNAFRFTFEDPFRVDVYEPADWNTGPTMGSPIRFKVGDVDSIVVAVSAGPPEKGQLVQPPWPVP